MKPLNITSRRTGFFESAFLCGAFLMALISLDVSLFIVVPEEQAKQFLFPTLQLALIFLGATIVFMGFSVQKLGKYRELDKKRQAREVQALIQKRYNLSLTPAQVEALAYPTSAPSGSSTGGAPIAMVLTTVALTPEQTPTALESITLLWEKGMLKLVEAFSAQELPLASA